MILSKYNNGNTSVTILSDGTKIREYEGTPEIFHPESIDVKITDYCDLGCQYCHESSTKRGIHGDLVKLREVVRNLPAGVELAIGGGNPLSHPHLFNFLVDIKVQGLIANITINQGHLGQYWDLIETLVELDLVKGVGVSITSNNFKYIEKLQKISKNVVYHVIAGINSVDIIEKLIEIGNCKVLVLGYKQFGFGIDFYSPEVEDSLKKWFMYLPKYLGKCTLSFDNLAIEQLKVKRLFTDKGWEMFYMGDDFVFTMYIDAVKEEYAPTSRNRERKSFNDYSLIEYFNLFKNETRG